MIAKDRRRSPRKIDAAVAASAAMTFRAPVEVVPETAEQWETARWVGRVKSPTSNRAK